MQNTGNDRRKALPETARASLLIMVFGLAILSFLVLVERPHWFHIRPMSGVANALSAASTGPTTPTVPAVR